MATIRLDFVSQDHMVFTGEVNEIIAPGAEGQLGILPKHAPLLTVLRAGEVVVRREGAEDEFFAISGGWMEVLPNKVTILAQAAERAEEIDLARAEAARTRAEQSLAQGLPREERASVEVALQRSLARMAVARRRRSRGGSRGEG